MQDSLILIASILAGSIFLFALGIGVFYLLPQLYRWIQVNKWRRIRNTIALTYDDGPDNETTPALLDLLKELNVKATFYLVGFRADQYPHIVKRLTEEGHEVGTHSYSHKHAWKISPWEDFNDAMGGYRSLAPAIGGYAPYRPPFGKIALPTLVALLARGHRVDWWTTPTNDTDDEFSDPETTAKLLIDARGPVMLLHSHHAEAHRRDFVIKITRALIQEAKRRNLQLVTMRELSRLTEA